MGDWFGPEQPWPAHPHAAWRASLEEARRQGWHLRVHSAHTFGTVHCRRGDDASCKVLIFTTGRATENVARQLAKKVSRCPHRGVEVQDSVVDLGAIGVRIGGANRLLDAATRLLDSRDEVDRVAELLDIAEEQVAALLEAAVLVERAAIEIARASGYPEAQVVSPFGVVDHADHELSLAEVQLAGEGGVNPISRTRIAAEACRGRIEILRARL